MKNRDKTKEQLIKEIEVLQAQIAELETAKSELRRAERVLRECEGKLNAMLLFIGDHMSLIDKDLNIIWANEVAKKMFGDDILGKKCHKIYYKRDQACEPCIAVSSFKDGKTHETYTQTEDKDGRIIYFHCTSNIALWNDAGKPTAVMETCRDVTELKKAELGLQSAYLELQETQRQLIQAAKMAAVGQLAGGVAHEVKNPLAVIMHCVNYLEKGKVSPKEQSKKLNMIKTAVYTSDKIIRGLLDFSRPVEIELKPCRINKVFIASLELVEKQLTLENIKTIKKFKDELPLIMADTNQMQQVFINVILNSLQAMPKGGELVVRTYSMKLTEMEDGIGDRKTDSFKLGDTVLVCEVKDTGIGIAKENLDRVFDPFFTTKPPGKGTGLGLTITRSIIQSHKGHIKIDSKEFKGTKVTILLPVIYEK